MKTVFCLVFVLIVCSALTASAQRLEIENGITAKEPITVSGMVLEVKKYSFILGTKDGPQTVRLGRRVELQMKLHKPVFKPQARKLIVQLPNAKQSEVRREMQLPEQLYLLVKFAHKNQMNRVMSANPKRLNNYQLSGKPFPEDEEASAITGQLIKVGAQERYRLKTPDLVEHDIILGHQNASMDGFGIQDLTPKTTQVEVVGILRGDDIVASKAWFWPVENN